MKECYKCYMKEMEDEDDTCSNYYCEWDGHCIDDIYRECTNDHFTENPNRKDK